VGVRLLTLNSHSDFQKFASCISIFCDDNYDNSRQTSTKWEPTSTSKSFRSASSQMSCVSFSVSDAGRCVKIQLFDFVSIATHTDQYFEMVSSRIGY
jgi:hypothetical protein